MRSLDSNGDTIVPEASSSDTSKNSIHPNALLSSVLVQTLVLKGIGPKKTFTNYQLSHVRYICRDSTYIAYGQAAVNYRKD